MDGFLQNQFVQKTKFDITEYVGTITDGRYKLDILLYKTQDDDINFEIGRKIRVIGDLQESGIDITETVIKIIKMTFHDQKL